MSALNDDEFSFFTRKCESSLSFAFLCLPLYTYLRKLRTRKVVKFLKIKNVGEKDQEI